MLRDTSHPLSSATEREASGIYSRQEVCRLLQIELRRLRSWERQQLIPEATEYRFRDFLVLKTIAKLRREAVPVRRIRQALEALRQRLQGALDTMDDVRVYREGRRVRVQIGKQKMEPVSGQLVFDFAENEIAKLLQLPGSQKSTEKRLAETLRNRLEADRWFERGLELEQTGASIDDVIQAYVKATELDPHAAGALVNLGTVYFNGHAWAEAEVYYHKALQIDPNYPLAHFNLGNLYDEQGDAQGALEHYQAALKIQPRYADVHYNLALLHQSSGQVMNAVRHWRAYLKLDGKSVWGEIARRELQKLEALTVVPGRGSGSKVTELRTEIKV